MKRTLDFAFLLRLAGCCLFLEIEAKKIDYTQPISPSDYQKIIGQGFAVKYLSRITDPPLKMYKPQNIDDLYEAGFRNVRLRSCAGCFRYPYDSKAFDTFLDTMETIVNKCLEVGVTPIISWAFGEAEVRASTEDKKNFIRWWTKVAKRLQDKDYRLGFNLVTELGGDSTCRPNCDGSLKQDIKKFTKWMTDVRKAIRETGGNNKKRMLIFGPPSHGPDGLAMIDKSIYGKDPYIMAEYHTYAAGATNKTNTGRNWDGCGTPAQRQNLLDKLKIARKSPLKTYWGAWMVQDNKLAGINQREAECFAKFFVSTLKKEGTPWSLNAFDDYYDTREARWRTESYYKKTTKLNFAKILNVIKNNM